jgi:mono/diheme cytochrome c family protein
VIQRRRTWIVGATRAPAVALAAVIVSSCAQRAPMEMQETIADFVEPGFPFIGSTVDARDLGASFSPENVATRGIVLLLGNDTYATFDPDLLRMAVGWTGEFLELVTMAQISYQEPGNKDNQIPKILGRPIFTTGIYPGWTTDRPTFKDPRPLGPNPDDVGRGPLPRELGRWNGIYAVGDQAVLSYSVQGVEILEQPGSLRHRDEVGITRTFRVGGTTRPLTLVVAEAGEWRSGTVEGGVARIEQSGDSVTVVALNGDAPGAGLRVHEERYVTLELPAGLPETTFRVLVWRGVAANEHAVVAMAREPVRMIEHARGGERRWDASVRTEVEISPDTAAYVYDRINLPFPNPWGRNARVAALAFFRDNRRAAAVTFEGDVWIVSGFDRNLRRLEWRRFASGLYEPLGVEVVDETVYAHSRDGIVRLQDLNGNGEVDFYESFSNLAVQSIESREFPLGFAARPGGGFFLSRGGALDMGPRTAQPIMPGFRAGSRHSGSILEVSADGSRLETYASGLREPFIGVHPTQGIVTASDQEGNFVPATPIFIVPRGGYHGVPATAHREEIPPETPPILWIPHNIDQSGASQVWTTEDALGFDGDALIHLSYGRPAAYRVYIDDAGSATQGALVMLLKDFPAPLLNGRFNSRDGSLYLAGFQIWGSRATEWVTFGRLRYTGLPSPFPSAVRSGKQGVVIRFAHPLDPEVTTDLDRFQVRRWNYRRTAQYGSGHYTLAGEPGQEVVPVAEAHLSADQRSLLLLVADMREVMQMDVGYTLAAADGRVLNDTVYLTVNHVDELDLAAEGFDRLDWGAALAAAGTASVEQDTVAASTERGAEIYVRIGCTACHSVDGSTTGRLGPSFLGLYGSERTFQDGSTLVADEAYIRSAILEPSLRTVAGFDASMPSYSGVLSEPEVESLVRYIRSLGGAGN